MSEPVVDSKAPLWRNVSFHLLWSSTFASGVGDRLIMNAALPLLGYALSGADNSSITSGIDFFFFLPYLLWTPVAGWLADRLPRKWLMFAADELRGLIVLGVFLFMPGGHAKLAPDQQWKVWATICAVGVMAATFVPAKLSIVPSVVGDRLLTRANAAVVSMGVIGNLMGFIVGGLVVKHGVGPMVLTSALCYLISGTFWVFLKTPFAVRAAAVARGAIEASAVTPLAAVREIAQGMRYAWSHRAVRMLIFTAALIWAGTSIYMPALAVVNVVLYHGTASQFMFVAAPVGFGMLLGALVLGVMNPRLGSELLISAGLACCGLFIGLQMIVPSFGVGIAIALATGLGAGLLLVPLNTLLQRITADHIRGRVFAAKEVVTEFGKVAVSYVIWQLPHTDPYMRPIAGGLAVALVVTAIYGLWRFAMHGPGPTRMTNLLWRVDRFYCQVVHRLRVRGRHHVPHRGSVVIVSNHTAGLDPALIQAAAPRLVRWMMAREYMSGLLGWLWRIIEPIGVRRGRPDAAAARHAVERLRGGEIVGIFPEGHINREGTAMAAFGPGVAAIARMGQATIVPVAIAGTPYSDNPLVSYLKPSRSRVTFGPPFRLDPDMDDEAAAAEIRRRIETLMGDSV